MKKILGFLLIVLSCVHINAQKNESIIAFRYVSDSTYVKELQDNGDATMLAEIDLPAEKLYRYCREWFASISKNHKITVDFEDKENKRFIANCIFPITYKGKFKDDVISMEGTESFKLTCDFKDGRFRVKASGYVCDTKDYFDSFPRSMQRSKMSIKKDLQEAMVFSGTPDAYRHDYKMLLSGMVIYMKEYIVKAAKDEDF